MLFKSMLAAQRPSGPSYEASSTAFNSTKKLQTSPSVDGYGWSSLLAELPMLDKPNPATAHPSSVPNL